MIIFVLVRVRVLGVVFNSMEVNIRISMCLDIKVSSMYVGIFVSI